MNFSKTTAHALRVLTYMAAHEKEMLSAKTLNGRLGIPHQYLRQLLTSLSKSHFIRSTHGRNGGFLLNKDIHEIFIADVIEAIEGSMELFNVCILSFSACPFEVPCPMHEKWTEPRNEILNILKSTSLADMIKPQNN